MRALLVSVVLCGAAALGAQTPPSHATTKADIEKWMTQLSNWSRWGPDDQMGTVNTITAARRKAAAALVREGFSVSLARDADTVQAVDNPSPFTHKMADPVGGAFYMDEYSVFFHGFAHTHMDSLSHVFYAGQMYNGFPATAVTKDEGASKLAITEYRDGIFARGVLVDIPKLKKLPYLEPGTLIYPEDLEAWEKMAGVRIAAGDVVFVRTGRWAYRAAKGPWDISTKAAGLHASVAPWLKARDIAILGGDGANDAVPSGIEGADFPLHQLLLVAMGTPMFDQCDLEAVAAAANARNRSTFLLTAAPLRVKGGTGAALNLTATF